MSAERHVHPKKPFINGQCFCDTYGMNESVERELCYQGMLFVTTLKVGLREYSGMIIARNLDHAKERAADRGFGETVDGQLEAFGEGHIDD